MASGSRVLWKGAISFGLVHIPVSLHTASSEQGIDFDWLDKRSMDAVGYKRINKKTGEEVTKENIVKGIAYEEGQYVILSADEITEAYPRATQTIEIERFVDAAELPFLYLDRPYYLSPINKGQKVYALLRETLRKTGKVGLAKVVIQTRQHLAALVPSGPALVLNLLRWGDEVKPLDGLELPAEGTQSLSANELRMAEQLVADMQGPWDPDAFKDEFKHAIMALVQKKVKAGKTETVLAPDEAAPSQGADVIDLTELLARSLKGGSGKGSKGADAAPAKASPAKAATKLAAKKIAPAPGTPKPRKAA